MKVVAFCGSPRKKGNTYLLLNEICGELEKQGIETEIVNVGGRDIHGCIGCGKCRIDPKGICTFDDDCVNESIRLIREADGVILGSPVYFGDVTGQLKCFIDRVGYAGKAVGAFKGKPCAGVAVMRRSGALATVDTINKLFTNCEGVIVGSSYWNIGIGRNIGEVLKDEEAMRVMKTLGQNMATLLKK